MKVASVFWTCLFAGSAVLAADESFSAGTASEPAEIKEMIHAPATGPRTTRTAGRSEDADTGMAAPFQGVDSGIKSMNDNRVSHSQFWHRKHHENMHSQTTLKTNPRKTFDSGTTGATTATTTTKTEVGSASNVTAEDQAKNEKDLAITREIRQEVMNTNGLSTRAHNLMIVSSEGQVTIRGTVPKASEKSRVEQIARGVSGVSSVTNLIQVSR